MKLTDKNGLRMLEADPGHLLYRVGNEENRQKIFYLGVKDLPENFKEISEEEAIALESSNNQL